VSVRDAHPALLGTRDRAARSMHEYMADSATRTVPATETRVRPYRPLDHRACRALWAELVGDARRLYRDAAPGGTDAGAGFEHYLARLEVSGMWVADHPEAGVVGFVGLLIRGRGGHVDPIVVSERFRGAGIGRALLDRIAAEARRRNLLELSIAPSTRNVEAIRTFHAAGYDVLATLTLTLDLTGQDRWQDGIALHDLPFRY
jgi:GNAT superfamily N-acetyltransferase